MVYLLKINEEKKMTENEKKLIEDFRRLLPENKNNLLSLAHVTKEAQDNTMRLYGLDRQEPPVQAGKTA
jgi:DNA replication initiation complex subunit (GINS family)